MNPLEQKAIEAVIAARDLITRGERPSISRAIKVAGHIYSVFIESVAFARASDAITADDAERLESLVSDMRAVTELED